MTQTAQALTPTDETEKMKRDGWAIFPPSMDANMVARLNADLESAYETCRRVQIKNGIAANMDGTAHHLIGHGDSFLELLDTLPLWDFVDSYFEGNKYIINSFGGFLNPPGSTAYVTNMHRDLRTFSGDVPQMLNMLVMLDDFTLENGATYLGTGTHLRDDKPNEEQFFATADRAVGKAGSVLFFNANMWHSAGINKTNVKRSCLTLTFTRPFMKQQCDYPRVLGYEMADSLSEQMKQVLGYNSRVPASLEEWYQPPEKRMYKPGQG